MSALSPMDLDLLDFLCICAERKIKVVRVNVSREAALARLRDAGLVHWNRFDPSPSALVAWIERQRIRSEAATCARAPDEPPAPKAADACGDGDARKVAPSPKPRSKYNPTIAEKARRFEQLPRQRGKRDTRGAVQVAEGEGPEPCPRPVHPSEPRSSREAPTPDAASPTNSTEAITGTPRKGPSATESTAAKRKASTKEPAPLIAPTARARPKVDIKVNAGPRVTRPLPAASANEAQAFQRQVQRAMRTNRANAEAFLDSGKTSGQAKSVSLKIAARKVELARIETARLEDPIEQAKTIIRRAGWVCFSAIISGGPVGKFYIGTRLVTEAQLLAQAEQLRARRRVG